MPRQPLRYEPRLETAVDVAPSGADWLHELDYRGERLGLLKRAGRAHVLETLTKAEASKRIDRLREQTGKAPAEIPAHRSS